MGNKKVAVEEHNLEKLSFRRLINILQAEEPPQNQHSEDEYQRF